jgi:hypothetical protein
MEELFRGSDLARPSAEEYVAEGIAAPPTETQQAEGAPASISSLGGGDQHEPPNAQHQQHAGQKQADDQDQGAEQVDEDAEVLSDSESAKSSQDHAMDTGIAAAAAGTVAAAPPPPVEYVPTPLVMPTSTPKPASSEPGASGKATVGAGKTGKSRILLNPVKRTQAIQAGRMQLPICALEQEVGWSGVQWSAVECSGVQWSVVEWSGV